jgi:hypothetical protein
MIGKAAHISFGRRVRNFLLRSVPGSSAERLAMALYDIDY